MVESWGTFSITNQLIELLLADGLSGVELVEESDVFVCEYHEGFLGNMSFDFFMTGSPVEDEGDACSISGCSGCTGWFSSLWEIDYIKISEFLEDHAVGIYHELYRIGDDVFVR